MPIALSLDLLLLPSSVSQRAAGYNTVFCPVLISPFLFSSITLLVSQLCRNDPSVHTFFDNTFPKLPNE